MIRPLGRLARKTLSRGVSPGIRCRVSYCIVTDGEYVPEAGARNRVSGRGVGGEPVEDGGWVSV